MRTSTSIIDTVPETLAAVEAWLDTSETLSEKPNKLVEGSAVLNEASSAVKRAGPSRNKPSDRLIQLIDPNPTEATVFISYKRLDWDEFVRPLILRLYNGGIPVWVDQYCLEMGKNWHSEIDTALDKCGRLILCITPEAVASRFVAKEYRYFDTVGKPYYPLMCRETKLPPTLALTQYASYGKASIDRLIRLLKNR